MTVNELIAEFNRLNQSGSLSGDEELRIHAFGGMRIGKKLKDISVGFDWDKGSIILHPEVTLTIHEQKKPCTSCVALREEVRKLVVARERASKRAARKTTALAEAGDRRDWDECDRIEGVVADE